MITKGKPYDSGNLHILDMDLLSRRCFKFFREIYQDWGIHIWGYSNYSGFHSEKIQVIYRNMNFLKMMSYTISLNDLLLFNELV